MVFLKCCGLRVKQFLFYILPMKGGLARFGISVRERERKREREKESEREGEVAH